MNLYRSVFSLNLRSRGLGISLSERSEKVLSWGLWSTQMTRSLQLRTKYRAFSKASTTANASPSIGGYRDLACDVNQLLTRVVFQPVMQQKGTVGLHEQCFCSSQ